MPQSGVFRLDGSNMENNGEQPDYLVPMSPEDWLANRDPQLDKAIELLTSASPPGTSPPSAPKPTVEAAPRGAAR
jgi:tricorn protease